MTADDAPRGASARRPPRGRPGDGRSADQVGEPVPPTVVPNRAEVPSRAVVPRDRGRFLTRGQPAAVGVVRALLAKGAPGALLLVGPPSAGKTTLALDIAAALLCGAPDPGDRPCRECRACRLVANGDHADLHRLAPAGAGRLIGIGAREHPDPGTVRHLIAELALLPYEGGARVAILEDAHRMGDDAQNALLKTLEEPSSGVTIILCVTEEERLLPTVVSRCARVRVAPVGARDIEDLLAERGVADAPTAARLARISGGRPGLALAYARVPGAVLAREEIARSLLDLLRAGRAARLAAIRGLQARAGEMIVALAEADRVPSEPGPGGGRRRRAAPRPAAGAAPGDTRGGAAAAASSPDESLAQGAEATVEASAGGPDDASGPARASAAERRRAAGALLDVWRDVARDLIVAGLGGRARVRDPTLLDDLEAAGRALPAGRSAAFLARLDRTAAIVEGNANPELALDVLVLAWSHAALAA